jgi:hypothetical protein
MSIGNGASVTVTTSLPIPSLSDLLHDGARIIATAAIIINIVFFIITRFGK